MNMYAESADFIRAKIPESLQNPKVAIICGSGLGGLAGTIRNDGKVEFDYSSIPHFPRSTGKIAALLICPCRRLMEDASI